MRIAGLTDYQIAVRTFETARASRPTRRLLQRLVRRYEELLPASLPRKQGHVLPNVREILEHLRAAHDVRSYLLTGNTRGGARGQADALRPDRSSFPTARSPRIRGDRATIAAPRARAGAARRARSPRTACSSSATRRTTSSAPTRSARGRLPWRPAATRSRSSRRTRPWRVFDELPPPDEFMRLIDERPSRAQAAEPAALAPA